MARLTRSRSNLNQPSSSESYSKCKQKNVNVTIQPNLTLKKNKNSPQVIIVVSSSSDEEKNNQDDKDDEEDELIASKLITTSTQLKPLPTHTSIPSKKIPSNSSSFTTTNTTTTTTTTTRRYPIRNCSLKNKFINTPLTTTNLNRIKKCELSPSSFSSASASSSDEETLNTSSDSSDDSAPDRDIKKVDINYYDDDEGEAEQEEEEKPTNNLVNINSKFKIDSSLSGLSQEQTNPFKPFRFSNSGKIKFKKKNHENFNLATKPLPSILPIIPPTSTFFVPLLSGEEPRDAVKLRQSLCFQSLETLHSSVEATQTLLFQPLIEDLLHFVDQAWNESMVSTRFLDALPTAIVFTNGMDPYALFQVFQSRLDPSVFTTIVFTKESTTQFSSFISPIVQLYSSTSPSSMTPSDNNKENKKNKKVHSDFDQDLDQLPRNQSPICICMIPSFESISTSYFSEWIELIPKGFRIIFVIALATTTEHLATQLSPKAYQRLYLHVSSFPSFSTSLDMLIQQFFMKSIQAQFYYQVHPKVMDFLMSSAAQVHGSFMTLVLHLKYMLFDFFFSQPLSCLVNANHRRSIFSSSSSSFHDSLVLIKSLPSVFQFLKTKANEENTVSSDSSLVLSLVTQPSCFLSQLHQWLDQLDLHLTAQSIVLSFLHQCQSYLNMEPKKSFTELYQLALEESLMSSGFAQTIPKVLKTLCEMYTSSQPSTSSKESLNQRRLLTEPQENETLLSLNSNLKRLIQVFQLFLQLVEPHESCFPKEVGQTKADLTYLESFLSFPFNTLFSVEQLPLKKRTSTAFNDISFPSFLPSKKRKLSSIHPNNASNASFSSSSSSSLFSCDSSQDGFASIYPCVQRLWRTIETWMAPISSFPCHEIYIYRRKHVLEQAFYPNPPQALHHVLSHPQHYMSSPIPPDISLLHRLYMEAPKTIGLADFYEAFKVLLLSSSSTTSTSGTLSSTSSPLSSRSRSKSKTTSKLDTETSLMVRFLRGMGELEYVGWIQKKKRGSNFHSTSTSSETVTQHVIKLSLDY